MQISRLLLSSPFNKYIPIDNYSVNNFRFFTIYFRKPVIPDRVYPLSLLAFVATAHTLSVIRQSSSQLQQLGKKEIQQQHQRDGFSETEKYYSETEKMEDDGKVPAQVERLPHVFRRHVKPKKQHEIINLGKVWRAMIQCKLCHYLCVCVCVCVGDNEHC